MKKSTSFYKKVIAAYLLIAILAPLLANEKPLYLSIDGKSYFPAFTGEAYIQLEGQSRLMNTIDWKNLKTDVTIFAPVRWSPGKSDLTNSYVSPFDKQFSISNGESFELPFAERHFLGTGKLGNDTFAELIHGTRVSVLIGLLSIVIALFIGVILGGIAGYFGDYSIRVSRTNSIISLLLLIPAWFYGFYLRSDLLSRSFETNYFAGVMQLLFSLLIFVGLISLPFILNRRFSGKRKVYLPLDTLISRLIELFVAIPRVILILTIAALTRPSIGIVILLIGITSWTEIARMVRSQLLQLKKQNYVEAARSTGMTSFRLLTVHILPNMKDQILSIAIFGVAAAIMTETGLSFLGVGVPSGTPTWGQIMFEARQHYTAWWLVMFSGMAISGLLYSLYLISQNRLAKTYQG